MTIYITTVRGAAERLSKAHTNASAFAKEMRAELNKAASHTDPHLSAEGLTAKRRELAQASRDAGRVNFDKIAENVEWAQKSLAAAARENVRIADDPAALIRAQQRWAQVQQRLDAGQDLHTLLRDADETTARAIAEFAPSWASAKYTRPEGLEPSIRAWLGETPDDAVSSIHRAVYRRLADASSDPNARELFAAAEAAETQVAIAQPWLDAGRGLVDQGPVDFLAASIASAIAAQGAAPSAEPATAA